GSCIPGNGIFYFNTATPTYRQSGHGGGGSPLMSEVKQDASSGMVLLSEGDARNAADRESFKSYSAIALVAAGVLASAWFFYERRRNLRKTRPQMRMRRRRG
ncbi:MAG: hypothetical protein V1708_04585, partial [Candidatus Micrarchaeota archaeon]